jgi:CBS domain-containing protein
MRHRTVDEVMTREVVRVAPQTGFRAIVDLLRDYDITAVPVVDPDGRPLGVVSEADLLRTLAAQDDPGSLLPAGSPEQGGADTAQALMTSPAGCTTPAASVVAAARLMARHQVKRLLVVDDTGRLVGLVSRADLLGVFLRSDQEIRREILEDVLVTIEGVSPAAVGVEVAQGRVTLSGTIDPPYLVPIVLRLCRSVDGVVAVSDRTNAENEAVT